MQDSLDTLAMLDHDISGDLSHGSMFRPIRNVAAKIRQPSADCEFCKGDPINDPSFCKDTLKIQNFQIYYEEKMLYKISCLTGGLKDPGWPAFQSLKKFRIVELVCCSLPSSESYTAVLLSRNITATKLKLLNLPSGTVMTAVSLAHVPATLNISSVGRMSFTPNAMGALNHLTSLSLYNVDLAGMADRLPPHLEELELYHTGISALPPVALVVNRLSVHEKGLTSFSQPLPNLYTLSVSSPVVNLPNASLLQTLAIHGDATKRLSETDLSKYPLLVLQIDGKMETLPEKLLKYQTAMVVFIADNCGLTSIPPEFFEDTRRIFSIDLSRNNLETLPSTLFEELTELRWLTLNHNKLTKAGLYSGLTPLNDLTRLQLKGNPLSDLCSEDGNSGFHLPNLELLILMETNLTRICHDWWRLPKLNVLFLVNNKIRSLSCTEMHVANRTVPLTVLLTRNPINCITCTQEQVNKGQRLHVEVTSDKPVCGQPARALPEPVETD